MFRDSQSLLKHEAKRSPELAQIIANIASITESDIRALKKLPWIRAALLELKGKAAQAQMALDIEQYIVTSVVADPIGQTRRWLGDTTYIKIGKRQTLLEIRTGQYVWLDGKGGVWLDTVYSEVIDPALMARSERHGDMSRLEYMTLLRDGRNKTVGDVPYTQMASNQHSMPQASSLFTIFRPN
jgi:hypothetical protein